jgi:hypothetical protein
MRGFAFILVAAGCNARPPANAPSAPMVAASSGDEVVATVEGRPIYAADVRRQAIAGHLDRKAALDELIDAELVAGEAARRGLDRDLSVHLAAKGALVRRLLATGFEREVTPSTVPAALVRRAYDREKALNHDLVLDVSHMLLPIKPSAPAPERDAARARMEKLALRVKTIGSEEGFEKLGRDEGLLVERFVTPRTGFTESSFSIPVFDQLKKPGDTSTVLSTSFGFHVAYLNRVIPPQHIPLKEVEPKIRSDIFPEYQRRAFSSLVDEAMARHRLELHAERLEKVGPLQ